MPSKILKTYDDPKFMNCREARPIRILSEYIGPEKQFKDHNIMNTAVFFGSARIKPEKSDPMSKYYWAAEELAFRIANWSKTIEDHDRKVYICSGGGPGIMEAANRGANRAGEHTIGLNISLPFEQYPNPYISPELNFEFHYFYMRKLWFLYHAKALIVFPGGFGTFDELFESLTLLQTKKIEKKHLPVLLYDKSHWDKLINFQYLVDTNMIHEEDLHIFQYFNSPEEGMEILVPQLEQATLDITRFL